MRDYTLGVPLETYGPNIRAIGIIVVTGGMFCGLAYAVAADVQGKTVWDVFFGMTAVFVGLLLHHLLSRVWVHDWGFLFEDFLGTESCAGKTSSASTSMLMNFMRMCSHWERITD